MLAMFFSTARSEITKVLAIARFVLPSGIRERTSRSLGVRVSRSSVRRVAVRTWATTSGSSAVPPRCYSVQRVDELGDIAYAILEQVSDAGVAERNDP